MTSELPCSEYAGFVPEEEMTIYLHPKLVEKAHKAAEADGEDFNNWVVEAARRQLWEYETDLVWEEWADNYGEVPIQELHEAQAKRRKWS